VPETKNKYNVPIFMEDVRKFTQSMFPHAYLTIFAVHSDKLSEFIAALINSKPLQAECEALNLSTTDRQVIERLTRVKELCGSSRSLLYNFNKQKLSEFFKYDQKIENLIIMEYFLHLAVLNLKTVIIAITTPSPS